MTVGATLSVTLRRVHPHKTNNLLNSEPITPVMRKTNFENKLYQPQAQAFHINRIGYGCPSLVSSSMFYLWLWCMVASSNDKPTIASESTTQNSARQRTRCLASCTCFRPTSGRIDHPDVNGHRSTSIVEPSDSTSPAD